MSITKPKCPFAECQHTECTITHRYVSNPCDSVGSCENPSTSVCGVCTGGSVTPQGHSHHPVHPPLLVTSNHSNKGKPGPPPSCPRNTHTHTHLKENKAHCFASTESVCVFTCLSSLMYVSVTAAERRIGYTLALQWYKSLLPVMKGKSISPSRQIN